MAPIIKKVSQERGLLLMKVDADKQENESVLEEFDVRSIPTLILVDRNKKVLGTLVGAVSERDLNNWIDNATGVLF